MDWQEILRDTWQTSLVFFSLLVLASILGKTQVGQLTFYEYICGITIGSIAGSIVSAEPDKFWSHGYDLALFVILTYIISFLTIKNRFLRKLIQGSPTIVIQNGRILIENMRGMRYDLDELKGQLRQQGILNPAEVQFAMVETSGELSIIKKSAYEPLTKSDFGIHLADPKLPIELIMDGQLIEDHLQKNYSKDWLEKQLAAQNIQKVSDVTYAVIDSNGQLFVSRKTAAKNHNDTKL